MNKQSKNLSKNGCKVVKVCQWHLNGTVTYQYEEILTKGMQF